MGSFSSEQISRRVALGQLSTGVASILAAASWSLQSLAAAQPAAVDAPSETSWPSFRGTPDQRGIAKCTLAEKPELKWEVASPDGWVAGVAIVGEHVFAPALCGYLHCFDLKTGQVVWFNHLLRASGDMREAKAADESFDALLKGFPPLK